MAKRDKNDNHNVMATAIKEMSYGDLLKIGEQLIGVRQQRPETAEEFAKLLHRWAEAQ